MKRQASQEADVVHESAEGVLSREGSKWMLTGKIWAVEPTRYATVNTCLTAVGSYD